MKKLFSFMLACALCLSAAAAIAWEDYNTPAIGMVLSFAPVPAEASVNWYETHTDSWYCKTYRLGLPEGWGAADPQGVNAFAAWTSADGSLRLEMCHAHTPSAYAAWDNLLMTRGMDAAMTHTRRAFTAEMRLRLAAAGVPYEDEEIRNYYGGNLGATWLWQAEDQRMLVCCHLQDLVMVFTAAEGAALPSPSLFAEILGTLTMPGFEPNPAPSKEGAP